jgi:hypothetical protein
MFATKKINNLVTSYLFVVPPCLLLVRKVTEMANLLFGFASAFFSPFLSKSKSSTSSAQLIGTLILFYEMNCCSILESKIKPRKIFHCCSLVL